MNFFSEGKLYQINDYSLQYKPLENPIDSWRVKCKRCGKIDTVRYIKERGCSTCSNGYDLDNYSVQNK